MNMYQFQKKFFATLAALVLIMNMGHVVVFAENDGDNTEWEGLNPGIKEEQTDEGDLGMVVSAHPLASEVGAQVLREGGNAVDAAVAMQFALNVVEPMMSGIGGGGFMMYYDAQTEDISIMNSRERAPAGATADMFIEEGDVVEGEGTFLLSAINLQPQTGDADAFHIGELSIKNLESGKVVLEDDFSKVEEEPTEPSTDHSASEVEEAEDEVLAETNEVREGKVKAETNAAEIDESKSEEDGSMSTDSEESMEGSEAKEEDERAGEQVELATEPRKEEVETVQEKEMVEDATWDLDKYELNEKGTTFTLDEEGGKITFGESLEGRNSSMGLVKSKMEKIENSELFLTFKLDDPGEDKRMRIWLRADDFRSGSTFAQNGYGIEIDSHKNIIKVIQSKDSTSTTIDEIPLNETTDWQHLRFHVKDAEVKLRVWDTGEEPEEWNVDETIYGSVMPFQERVRSGKSVGVPGTLKGLEEAQERWGSDDYSLSDLMQPAIEYAENGVKVNWSVASAIKNNVDKLSGTAAKDVFLPNGTPLQEGDLLVQKDLANTFKMIAEQGTNVFYDGEIADAIAEEVQNKGGSMKASDLASYKTSSETPLRGQYKGYEIVTMPPPSSGGLTMLQMLKMSELLDLTNYDVQSFEKYHLLVESMHLAYADRAKYMGDPDTVDIPKEGLLNEAYMEERVSTIDHEKANKHVEAGNPWAYQNDSREVDVKVEEDDKEDGETTHFTVADQWGNMVSYTTTIEQLFGSGIMVDGYGITLNNELTDFDATPGGANEVTPGSRPLSSMTPTIVLKDGKPFMTVGSPGGATIITSVTQTIMNVIGYEMELKDAIEEPRIYSNIFPNIRWEPGIPDDVRAQVESAGHAWEADAVDIGNVNSILIDYNEATGKMTYTGAADSTREGSAIGISVEDEELDKTKLAAFINKVESEGLQDTNYTKVSWDLLTKALQAAKDVLEDETVDQKEVDEALTALKKAYEGLEEKSIPPAKGPNKTALQEKYDAIQAEGLRASDYSDASWKTLQQALEQAKTVLEDPNATEEDINAAFAALEAARDGLKGVDKEEDIKEKEEESHALPTDKSTGAGTKGLDGSDKVDTLPSTATSFFNWILAGLVIIGIAVVMFVLNKRRNV